MTALAGIWNLSCNIDPADALKRMLAAQRIYGPHGDASAEAGDIAIGRCLYETLPEDRFDRGPVMSPDGRYLLAGDVRLDDRDDLADALGLSREEAATLCDAAFLLLAWQRWQDTAFDHLYGDYAFALWDAVKARLVLARDPFGGRSLHYHQGKGFFAFASMPKGLHALPEVPYAPDEVRAATFLALMAERGPRSFFAGVSRVEAGQCVVVERTGIRLFQHWQPPARIPAPVPGTDYAEGLRAHLDRAVASRLRGAGKRVGAHLSAGFDSASVSATAARLMAAAGGKVVAFTSVPRPGFDGEVAAHRLGDEGDLAAATAAMHPNIEHVRVHSDGISALDDLDRDYFLFERPLANADNQHWWNQINGEARKREIGVMLTAAAGNATVSFTGLSYLPELTGRGRLVELVRTVRGLIRNREMRWRGALLQAFGPWIPAPLWVALYEKRFGIRLELAAYSMLNPGQLSVIESEAAQQGDFDPCYRPRRDATDLQRWMLGRVDFGNNQKGALAGWGVDLRDPTIDRRLVEYCMSIPVAAFLDRQRIRGLAKTAFAGLLPDCVLTERRKGHQAADWHESFALQHERVRSEVARLAQVESASVALDLEQMRALADDWPQDDWGSSRVEFRYRYALLRGLVSGHFLRKSSRSNA
ncbi:asparagine synthase-related protein [Sphingomonas psychrotolerans]|uniref:asparagine synthase (glutamine-hydrolyzing) n=1 Tax=Sphingomonas psychrotolerans TaxID=1327635 RepID=A0ABU3N5D2_9SPHN|nr:asparagine synthase-related protein [Sphingomonas psychrotolerans]MDT8759750.1 asparagine synthase-related protein [Sphingomonas psychrotolerans]